MLILPTSSSISCGITIFLSTQCNLVPVSSIHDPLSLLLSTEVILSFFLSTCCAPVYYGPIQYLWEESALSPGQVENSETSEITETSESDFPIFPFLSFRLRHRVYSKTRKMKTRKIFSEVSEISEKSEFSNCHFLPNFQKSG